MSNILREFREFAIKGNVVDLAVGVIIGGAFGKIVTSVVADLVMPPIGVVVGGVNFRDLKLVLREALDEKTPAVTLNYGQFLQNCLDFVIVAAAVFLLVKAINTLRRQVEAAPAPAEPPPPTRQEELLMEIRDLLKK